MYMQPANAILFDRVLHASTRRMSCVRAIMEMAALGGICFVLSLQDVSDKYNALLDLVGKGSTTYAERMAALPAMDTFFLRRSKDELRAMFPVSEKVGGNSSR